MLSVAVFMSIAPLDQSVEPPDAVSVRERGRWNGAAHKTIMKMGYRWVKDFLLRRTKRPSELLQAIAGSDRARGRRSRLQ
jgi:hypothetical protein